MVLIVLLLGIIGYKVLRKRELPDLRYTPFDNITGQTHVEFHLEKEVMEEENENGDGTRKTRTRK
ncbi:DUF3951 domain-containing protein [Paenibacillus antri]|uniref:DUF3951 domain-containing protein n=2 Tax=Paenibacillus antri TaxID=2582848 RepID=A0A5R9GBQ6_9BACL|nr:DUF3951 domain-containing protein [Paenibacillus antri]TLS50818.1 DUF3951 domain-containing protein [Paenibacillus antri]